MKRRKLDRRRSALRWLAAFLALAVLICATGIYCVTPEQALRKLARERDWGELQILETVDGEIFDDTSGRNIKKGYILQNKGMTCMAVSTYDWRYGWQAGNAFSGFTRVMEHGEQASVPVDFVQDHIEVEIKGTSSYIRNYVLGIILDPRVETVELSHGRWVTEGDEQVWEATERVTLNREDWGDGPYRDYFFYMFDPIKLGNWPRLRALDKDGNPITWTNIEGEQVEWYGTEWTDGFYSDWWNHSNGQRH